MALNMLLSIGPWIILLVISIIILGVIIFLTLTERILKRKVTLKQQREDNSPARRIKLLISSHEEPEKKLRRINAIAKEIFQDIYHIDSKISYYELADKFQKQGKKEASKFCQEMFTILYSGEEIQSQKTHELAKLLEKINQEAQEEKSFKKLEKSMKLSMKISKKRDSLLKKFSKTENKFIDKFAKDKKEQQKQQTSSISQTEPKPQETQPVSQQTPPENKSERKRLQNLPLKKLFRFRKNPGITLTTEINQDKSERKISQVWSSIKLKTPLLQKKKKTPKVVEKSTYQQIEDIQKEIIERQKQIEKMRTQQQIQELQRTAVEVEINKTEQWPPVKFTPKHLNETRKMSPETEKSFEKTNKEIELLEKEIKDKQKEIKKIQTTPVKRKIKPPVEKSNPLVEKIFGKSDNKINKEIEQKRKQIEVVNLKKEKEMYNSYNAPKVIIPKKQKIEAIPQKKPIKKEDFIHMIDNVERIKERIRNQKISN